MQKQEPNKILVQFHIEATYKELVEQSPDYHKGLIAHLARKGFIKEVETYLNQQEQEPLAS